MKILYLAGGLPHYYNLVLNKLQNEFNVEITAVVPKNHGATLGAGVHTSTEGIEFKVIFEEEYTTYYGKKFFKRVKQILKNEKPDLIMVNWPYQLALVFYPGLLYFLRKNKIAIISKEIPFQVPTYENALSFYSQGGGITENKESHQKTTLISKFKYLIVREARKRFSNLVDAHINYLDEAIEIHASYGVPKEKVFVTANSPDTDLIFQIADELESIQPNIYRLLHIGRLVKWKNVDLLIESTKKLKEKYPNVELDIVGTGPELESLKKLVDKIEANHYIRFHGGIYEPKLLGKIICEAGIYVLAGMGGLSINETMCYKKPIVCSVADGTEKKLVREDVNGYYFENNSSESLISTISKLFENPEKILQMGLLSKKIIQEEINIHTVLGMYLKAFNFAISKYKK